MKRLEAILGGGAALALFAMMALTFCDVIGRKLIGHSIPGSMELTELFMLLVIFLGIPLASLRAEHVVFDLLDAHLPQWGRQWQQRCAHLLCLLILLGASWLVEMRAGRTMEEGDRTAQLGIALGPLNHLAAALLLITACMHLVLLLRPIAERPHA